MKNKKALALIISVTLIVSMTLPGTLAVSEDQAAALDGHTLAEEESAAPTSEEPACTCGTETGVHTEACAQYTAPEAPAVEEKTCTCGMTDGTHTEDCPLYTAPEAPTEGEKTCTCDPKPAEGEPHKVGCPLYEGLEDYAWLLITATLSCTLPVLAIRRQAPHPPRLRASYSSAGTVTKTAPSLLRQAGSAITSWSPARPKITAQRKLPSWATKTQRIMPSSPSMLPT